MKEKLVKYILINVPEMVYVKTYFLTDVYIKCEGESQK